MIIGKNLKFIILSIVGGVLIFSGGWLLGSRFSSSVQKSTTGTFCKSTPLRINRYKFIAPLLVCDISSEKGKLRNDPLKSQINSIVNQAKDANKVSDVSVYFQDFKTDTRININPDIKFNPASLSKVAMMMAVYRIIESNPSILSQRIEYSGGDQNFGQEIRPADYLKNGQVYSPEEVVEKMIKYSDNNAFYLLLKSIDRSILESLYNDLQIPIALLSPEQIDFMTTKDASYFFRILYNATYLSPDGSEKALSLLSSSDFKNGIVAGVSEEVDVAHKFGLETIKNTEGQLVMRELHDCGIVYNSKNPYIICIMTKSTTSIFDIEGVIKDISSAVYKFQDTQ
jgi:beta-lactamase class A